MIGMALNSEWFEPSTQQINPRANDPAIPTVNDQFRYYGTYFTAFVEIAEGRCGVPQADALVGTRREMTDQWWDGFEQPNCALSHDAPSDSESGPQKLYFRYLIEDDSFLYGDLKPNTGYRQKEFIENQISGKEVFDLEGIYRNLNKCGGACSSIMVLSSMFGVANYFDAAKKPETAAQWRREALQFAADTSYFTSRRKAYLQQHLNSLYIQSWNVRDLSRARWVIRMLKDLNLENEDTQKLQAHLKNWSTFRAGDLSPKETTVQLLADNPLSDTHGAILRGVTSPIFELAAPDETVAHAQLECTDVQGDFLAVYLNTTDRTRWRIPQDWNDCKLLILGTPDAQISLVERPDGLVTDVGEE